MKKIFSWISDNILFLATLFLLFFIPLYPKLPLIDIKNTWVYVRIEDFIVLFVLLAWLALFIRKKISLKTPLTLPIIFFWIIGGISTLHGVLVIFPTIANVFPNIALLNFFRHIEYMSLFFIAYASIRDKKQLPAVIAVLTATLLFVVFYGLGQRYLAFPAYLTMNEEYAKGVAIQLSLLSRVPSTFAGHYDLAAYLVLILPILASLIFGIKNLLGKVALIITVFLGFGLMFMTVSRVSFFVLLVALFIVLLLQKKKLVLLMLPILAVLPILFLSLQPNLLNRFGSTVHETDVLVDAVTGSALGHIKFVPREYFNDKIVWKRDARGGQPTVSLPDPTVYGESSPSGILDPIFIPPQAPLLAAVNVSTGESLPEGTGYINLSLSPVTRKLGGFFYESKPPAGSSTGQMFMLSGDFLVKRAAAYDLSFTTRFQGEWPRALMAFGRNILLGSGYGSVSLAVDNNYLRMLGEIGTLGTGAFFAIFLIVGLYIKKALPHIESKLVKSFMLGFVGGVIGLALNATLIDVFEASKIAFLLWLLVGIVLGISSQYLPRDVNISKMFLAALASPIAIVFYLAVLAFTVFSPILPNFFTGDDFTWLRWAADCGGSHCGNIFSTILHYFTDAGGFFYRPGTKVYFQLMYSVFWLNPTVYHAVSLFLHFVVAALFYLLARRVMRSSLLAAAAAALFVIMSGYVEVVFWSASTGSLFNAVFALAALLVFIYWEENKKTVYLILTVLFILLATFFHEQGVVVPLLLLAYKGVREGFSSLKAVYKKFEYQVLFVPVIFYLVMRFAAGSHWFNGDYSYNIVKLPFNFVGNGLGYLFLSLVGPSLLPLYEMFRNLLKTQIVFATIALPVIVFISFLIYKKVWYKVNKEEKNIILFAVLFFVICLLPFLGLGNIASRYSYLATLGPVMILVLLLKKLYVHLLDSGRNIAISATALVIIVFSLFHIIQVQQIQHDWHGAGDRVKKFFVSIDELYADYWSNELVEFHFVNVPIRVGEAWVFPVGLPDALWFSFRNDNLRVYIDNTLDDALNAVGERKNAKVFQFQEDGSVVQITRSKITPDVLPLITPVPVASPAPDLR